MYTRGAAAKVRSEFRNKVFRQNFSEPLSLFYYNYVPWDRKFKVALHLSFQGSVVAAAVAAALASSSVLESLSPDGAIRHRHGRAIALPRGRKARHPTQSSQIVGAASRVRCCCSRWLTGVLRSRSCCRCRRRCSGADASLCATVDSCETRWTESFWVCLESIPDLGCVAARVV